MLVAVEVNMIRPRQVNWADIEKQVQRAIGNVRIFSLGFPVDRAESKKCPLELPPVRESDEMGRREEDRTMAETTFTAAAVQGELPPSRER
jgi:hypothetical protein